MLSKSIKNKDIKVYGILKPITEESTVALTKHIWDENLGEYQEAINAKIDPSHTANTVSDNNWAGKNTFDGDTEFNGNVILNGDQVTIKAIKGGDGDTLHVNGNLDVSGTTTTDRLEVNDTAELESLNVSSSAEFDGDVIIDESGSLTTKDTSITLETDGDSTYTYMNGSNIEMHGVDDSGTERSITYSSGGITASNGSDTTVFNTNGGTVDLDRYVALDADNTFTGTNTFVKKINLNDDGSQYISADGLTVGGTTVTQAGITLPSGASYSHAVIKLADGSELNGGSAVLKLNDAVLLRDNGLFFTSYGAGTTRFTYDRLNLSEAALYYDLYVPANSGRGIRWMTDYKKGEIQQGTASAVLSYNGNEPDHLLFSEYIYNSSTKTRDLFKLTFSAQDGSITSSVAKSSDPTTIYSRAGGYVTVGRTLADGDTAVQYANVAPLVQDATDASKWYVPSEYIKSSGGGGGSDILDTDNTFTGTNSFTKAVTLGSNVTVNGDATFNKPVKLKDSVTASASNTTLYINDSSYDGLVTITNDGAAPSGGAVNSYFTGGSIRLYDVDADSDLVSLTTTGITLGANENVALSNDSLVIKDNSNNAITVAIDGITMVNADNYESNIMHNRLTYNQKDSNGDIAYCLLCEPEGIDIIDVGNDAETTVTSADISFIKDTNTEMTISGAGLHAFNKTNKDVVGARNNYFHVGSDSDTVSYSNVAPLDSDGKVPTLYIDKLDSTVQVVYNGTKYDLNMTKAIELGLFTNDSDFVDLGLPSGTQWMKYNLGATTESDCGLYFQWGDTVGYTGDDAKTHSVWATVPGNGGASTYDSTSLATWDNSNTASSTVGRKLNNSVDAAYVITGGRAKIPTLEQLNELIANTTQEAVTVSGVACLKFVSNSNPSAYIILPVCGFYAEGMLQGFGTSGGYWASEILSSGINTAKAMLMSGTTASTASGSSRSLGNCIHAVKA